MAKNNLANNFMLFSNCIPVKGHKRSTICDLGKHSYFFIPNSLYDILTQNKDKTFAEIIESYGSEYAETIIEYFDYLLQNEVITFIEKEELENFPSLNLEWQYPAHISNAIIDYNESDYNIEDICKQLSKLNCKGVQLRVFSVISFEKISEIVGFFDEYDINSVELLLPYNEVFTEEKLKELRKKYPIIKQIIIHSSSEFSSNPEWNFVFITQKILDSSHCGYIQHSNFATNIELFSEAQNHNTCLNRKISIDVNGEIKNCPAMKKSYGNIKTSTLEQALNTEGFKDLWFINKDKIEVCKDCEFRYICTDCRAFIIDENNIYSKPAKCKYNPYTAEFDTKPLSNN